MHDIRYDAVHDEIVVTNPFANAILTFRGSANGEEPPIRVIQGPRTQLAGGTTTPDRAEVDPVNNELLVPNRDSILVFPREATGNVAPIRVIRGPETRLRGAGSLAVDPIRNLIVVNSGGGGELESSSGAGAAPTRRGSGLLIFNRTDNGNVKPQAVISGPKTELLSTHQMQVYPPKGWIIVTQITNPPDQEPDNVFVGIWSIRDNGDVPPRWKLGGPKSTLKKPRGVVLIPAHKELIVADMRLNSVLTYYFPELF